MSSLSQLCTELKQVLDEEKITLPNSAVTAIDVNGFLKNVLKTESIDFTSASVTCDDLSVTLTGSFTLFDVQLTTTWVFTAESDGSMTWKFVATTEDASKISNLLSQFFANELKVPANISSLDIMTISFDAAIKTGDTNYSLDLSAKTIWGALELFVKDNSGTYGTALGVSVSSGFNLSNIDSSLSVFNFLEFSDSAVVIANFTDTDLEIAGITGVVDGVEFRSTLTVASTSSQSALPIIINELSSSLSDIPLQAVIDLTQTSFKLTALIGKTFPLPGFSTVSLSDISMTIDITPPSVSLSGDLSLPITIPANPTVKSIDVTGAISFTYSAGTGTIQATLNSDTQIIEPFGFYGVTLNDVGVGLDVSFGVETGLGVTLEGAFLLGEAKTKLDEKFAITMEFTDDLPNPSLLYCQTKDLSLPVIFDAVIDAGSLPSVLSDFSFNELVFYWCDKAQQLPDGTSSQIGIGYNAAIDFWGFNTYSALMINKDSGITGQANIDPVKLLDGKITLTGKGQAGYNVKAGGAYFDFDTSKESFDVSVDANVLGITEVVNASVSSTSLDISMKTNLDFLQDSLAVEFKNGGSTMSFSSSLDIGIDCAPDIKVGGMNLGTIHIDEKMSGSIAFSFENGTLSAMVDAHFDFNGTSIGFKYDVGAGLTDLSNLASVIEDKIVNEAASIFSSFFADVKNYISVVGKGLITGGDFVVNVLYHVYKLSITDLFRLLSDLPTGFHVDGTIDFQIKIDPGIPAESFHADLGKIIDVHGDKHGDVWGLGLHIDKHGDIGASESFSTPAFTVDLVDIDAQQHFDMTMPPTVHADAVSPQFDFSPHLDAGIAGGSLGVSGKAGINSQVSLTNIELDARLDVYEHAGVHAGVHGDWSHWGAHLDKHVDEHGDKSAHIDEAV